MKLVGILWKSDVENLKIGNNVKITLYPEENSKLVHSFINKNPKPIDVHQVIEIYIKE